MKKLDVILFLTWMFISLAIGYSSGNIIPSLIPILLFTLGILKGYRLMLAAGVAAQLPQLVTLCLEKHNIVASALMLTVLYLAEIGDLSTRRKTSTDIGCFKRRFTEISTITAFSLVTTLGVLCLASSLSLSLGFTAIAVLALTLTFILVQLVKSS
ncbi:MAG: hypothetical protein QXY49_00540 [Thermofilaceae archaeon]